MVEESGEVTVKRDGHTDVKGLCKCGSVGGKRRPSGHAEVRGLCVGGFCEGAGKLDARTPFGCINVPSTLSSRDMKSSS